MLPGFTQDLRFETIRLQTNFNNSARMYYVNNNKETSGDGSSWVNASKSISLKDNATIFLAEGEYEIPGEHINITYIGMGKDTVITSFSFKQS